MFYEHLKRDDAYFVIVDAYSTGSYYPPRLNALGYQCIHVQSSPHIPVDDARTFKPNDFRQNIIYDQINLDEIISTLREKKVQFVLVGAESGVELADLLSERLGLMTNGTVKSTARRNKFEMIESIKEFNLRSVEHIKANNIEDLLQWYREQSDTQIVLKPLRGAGTDHVFFCHTEADIKTAFYKILNNKDCYGHMNLEVLAETYLDGTQYLVNMVSVNGNHVLSDFWELVKKEIEGGRIVHDYQRLLPCTNPLKNAVCAYTNKVLDALHIKHGGTHNEVFATKQGITLVESGARIMGAINPNLIAECIGRSQLELTLASYLQPEKFKALDMQDYELRKHLWAKMLISNQSGIVKNIKYLDIIKSLPSFDSMKLYINIGETVEKTIDLLTIPGIIYLCHEDEQVIINDHATISSLELEMFEV